MTSRAPRGSPHLVDHGHDGVVVSGTTGESPTTTVAEDGEILAAVKDAVGDRARVVAGVGTNSTAHSLELAQQAEKIGADGLLLVTPYYNKPGQAGVLHHFRTVAEATGVPVMLYDVPGRTGTTISMETYAAAKELDTVVAVKDAVGDFVRGVRLRELGYAIYSGDDANNLGWLAHGAAGFVSVVGHVAGDEPRAMIEAFDRGDHAEALAIFARLLPAIDAVRRRQLRRHHGQGRPPAARRARQPQRPRPAGAPTTTRSPRSVSAWRPPACCRPLPSDLGNSRLGDLLHRRTSEKLYRRQLPHPPDRTQRRPAPSAGDGAGRFAQRCYFFFLSFLTLTSTSSRWDHGRRTQVLDGQGVFPGLEVLGDLDGHLAVGQRAGAEQLRALVDVHRAGRGPARGRDGRLDLELRFGLTFFGPRQVVDDALLTVAVTLRLETSYVASPP